MKRQYVIIYQEQTPDGSRISYCFPGSLSVMEDAILNILFKDGLECDYEATGNIIIFAGQIKREFDFTAAIKITEKK